MTLHDNTRPPAPHPREVIYQAPSTLKKNPRNARTHSKRQVRQIADSITAFGFTNPILVDEEGTVLAGHGRLLAAEHLGLDEVPTLSISGLSQVQKRAYVLADNKLAENAGWDRELLALELGELSVLLPEVAFEWPIEVTGFARGEIEVLTHEQSDECPKSEDALPAPCREAPVSRRGDLWMLGRHRLLCGDAQSPEDVVRVMAGEKADVIITDPPYNVPIAGHVTRRKHGPHGEFAFASGEMAPEAFAQFLRTCLGNAIAVSRPGAIHAVFMDWRHIADLLVVGRGLYDALLNLCVWNKGSVGQGSLYRSQHELVAIFRVAGAEHHNHVALGRYGRNRSNVWSYPGLAGFGAERAAALAMHPTVKPVALVADALRDTTLRGERVLDPFSGSGTTIIAAEKSGRVAHGLEFEPGYVDVILSRWQAYTGCDAILDGSGTTFDEVEAERRAEKAAAAGDSGTQIGPIAAASEPAE